MKRFLLLNCAFGVVCFAQANGPSGAVEFEGRYWAPESSPQLKINAPAINTAVNFGPDLGTGNPQVPEVRFTLRPGNSRIQVGYDRFAFSGDQDVSRTIEFNGRIYTVGTRVVTDAVVNDFKVAWSYALVRAADGRFRIGPLVEGHAMWWDASLAAPLLALRAEDKRMIGFPLVGLAAEIVPHRRVAIFAEAAGITAGDYGRFYNVEAGVRAAPLPHLNFLGGYRIYDLYPKFDPDYARVRLRGPFVGAGVTF